MTSQKKPRTRTRRGVATAPRPVSGKFELTEREHYRLQAKLDARPVTYIANDGCEVTVHPDGSEWFNAADWY